MSASACPPCGRPRAPPLPLHEHDAPGARRPVRHPLGYAAELHAVFPTADADAVVTRAELVPDLPHLRPQAPAPARAAPTRQRASRRDVPPTPRAGAVVPRAELAPAPPHLRREAQAREGPEHQRRR